jgi:hypothetical protein
VAQDADAKRMLANADPKALGGMQERVFISFLNGEKLDPTDPLRLEANEEMKRDIGAEFERRQKMLAALAFAVAAGLFVFKNELAAVLAWIENDVGPSLALLPPEAEAAYFRPASLAAMFAAFVVWAVSAWRRPEVTPDGRYAAWIERIEGIVPLLRSIKRMAAAIPILGQYANRKPVDSMEQLIWRSCAAIGVALALYGIGDGPDSARLILLASLATAAWLEFTRLPMAGAATTLRVGYDDVQVCDPENRCTAKPGGIAQYPFGRAIVEDRWYSASLAVFACSLPAMIGLLAGVTRYLYDVSPFAGIAVALNVAALIVGWTLTLVLVRRLIIGQWLLPDRSWSKHVTVLSDILVAVAAGLFISAATLWLIEHGRLAAPFAPLLLCLCVAMVVGSIPLVALRSRGAGTNANLSSLLIILGIGLAGLAAASRPSVIELWQNAPVELDVTTLSIWRGGGVVLAATFIQVVFAGVGLLARAGHRPMDPASLRLIGFRALGTSVACLVPGALVFTAALLVPSFGLSQWPDLRLALIFSVPLEAIIQALPAYLIWRYVGPAAVDIELLKAEGRLQRPAAQLSTRAWWDTPWLALPLVAMFGLDLKTIGWWHSLAPMAIPVAVYFAARHGRAAIRPIAIGTLPFWLFWQFADNARTMGDVWPAIAILFWSKFAADPDFRARLLQRERLSWSDIALLALLLLPSVNLILESASLRTAPEAMLLTCAIVLAASRVPVRRTVFALSIFIALATAAWMLWPDYYGYVYAIQLGPALFYGKTPTNAVVALLCLVLVGMFRSAATRPGEPRSDKIKILRWLPDDAPRYRLDSAIVGVTLAYAFFTATNNAVPAAVPRVDLWAMAAIGFCAGIGIRRSASGGPAWFALLANIWMSTAVAAILVMAVLTGIIPGISFSIANVLNEPTALATLFIVWAGFVVFGHLVRRDPQAVLQTTREEPEPTIVPSVEADWLSHLRDGLRARIQTAQTEGRIGQDERDEIEAELNTLESNIGPALESNSGRPDKLAILHETRNSIADLRRDLEGIPAGPEPDQPERPVRK